MSKNSGSATCGVSLFSVIGIVFLILKLCKLITWPWIWVLAPFWIPVAAFIGCAVVLLIIGLIAVLINT